jgi:hypothetical protein
MRDHERLAAEAARLWRDLESTADEGHYSRAFLVPTNFSRRLVLDGWEPIVFSHESTAFCLQRNADGWKRSSGWPPGYRQDAGRAAEQGDEADKP